MEQLVHLGMGLVQGLWIMRKSSNFQRMNGNECDLCLLITMTALVAPFNTSLTVK